jgi:guanylate kinase
LNNKIIILTAPSGSGKSSIAKGLMQVVPNLRFSVSAATRSPRIGEVNGVHYHFMTPSAFEQKINNNEFAEWEKVYEGKYYGTLKTEIEHIWAKGQNPLLDIDVKGALSIQQLYGAQVLSIYIQVPIAELQKRLQARGTETPITLQERLDKAEIEAQDAQYFNTIVINDDLQKATAQVVKLVQLFLV